MVKELETELKVGVFVTLGVGLTLLAILALGGADSLFSRHNDYQIHFPSVDGLVSGAKVVVGGLQVGTVMSVDLDEEKKDIRVGISVNRKYQEWIRKDSKAEIATQGVLGDKYVILTTGNTEQPRIADGAQIDSQTPRDLSQFLTKGDQLMTSLNSLAKSLDVVMKSFAAEGRSELFFEHLAHTSKNLDTATAKLSAEMDGMKLRKVTNHLGGILEKIDNGTGTLGALVNDPGLYYDTKALIGGANRNRIIRNLVRKTIKDNEGADASDSTSDPTDRSSASTPPKSQKK